MPGPALLLDYIIALQSFRIDESFAQTKAVVAKKFSSYEAKLLCLLMHAAAF
jgi:hypothetical protein